MTVKGLGYYPIVKLFSCISQTFYSGLFILMVLFTSASSGVESSEQERSYVDSQIFTLSNSYKLLMQQETGPVISLATLFNGSGRVAADEFEKTISYLQGHYSVSSPWSLGFISKSHPPSCRQKKGCWMVSYSTDVSGVLRPGADVSRFTPLKRTIDFALQDENNVVIGPAFEGQSGSKYAYYGVTVQNTRQFGVLVSLIDYQALIRAMQLNALDKNIDVEIYKIFRNAPLVKKEQFLISTVEDSENKSLLSEVLVEVNNVSYGLRWFDGRN